MEKIIIHYNELVVQYVEGSKHYKIDQGTVEDLNLIRDEIIPKFFNSLTATQAELFSKTSEIYFLKLPENRQNIRGYIEALDYAKLVCSLCSYGDKEKDALKLADKFFHDDPNYTNGDLLKIKKGDQEYEYKGFKAGLNLKFHLGYSSYQFEEKVAKNMVDAAIFATLGPEYFFLENIMEEIKTLKDSDPNKVDVYLVQRSIDDLEKDIRRDENLAGFKREFDKNNDYLSIQNNFNTLVNQARNVSLALPQTYLDQVHTYLSNNYAYLCESKSGVEANQFISNFKSDVFKYYEDLKPVNQNLKGFCQALEYARYISEYRFDLEELQILQGRNNKNITQLPTREEIINKSQAAFNEPFFTIGKYGFRDDYVREVTSIFNLDDMRIKINSLPIPEVPNSKQTQKNR